MRAVLVVAALALVAACGPSAEVREAQQLLAAIERVRMAEHPEREPLIEVLERARFTGEVAETARSLCALAYRDLHEGRSLGDRVETAMRGADPPAIDHMQAELDRATRHLDAAKDALPRCSRAVVALKGLAGS